MVKAMGGRERKRQARRGRQAEISLVKPAEAEPDYRTNAKPADPFPPPPPSPRALYKDIVYDDRQNLSFKYRLRGKWFWKKWNGHFSANSRRQTHDEVEASVRRVLAGLVDAAELAERKGGV